MIASAPPVLAFEGLWLPYGPPLRVRREACAWPWEVRGPRGSLRVDASLPAPGDEGPYAPEAELFRVHASHGPCALRLLDPWACEALPGLGVARRVAARALLSGSAEGVAEESPAERASRTGLPHDAEGQGVDLEPLKGLLLWRDPAARAIPAELLPAPLARGGAVPPPAPHPNERARLLAERLREAGLRGSWALGGGVRAGICSEEALEAVKASLLALDLEPLPCAIGCEGLVLSAEGGACE